jgi:hypothetical protein
MNGRTWATLWDCWVHTLSSVRNPIHKQIIYHNREGDWTLEIEVLHMAVIQRSTTTLNGDFEFLMMEMSFTGESLGFAVRLRSC